ncbi:hypothetical protein [Stenotrophomonas acidaminiphila]|uniref:hypothetical protein n=1 Tax=Stenotrophomonas acidaminiphila TaxID=128780 RepID=UPI0015FD6FF5|nr:hypothetical protein [Stenotrophomonas acidaminiphila]
MGIEQFEARRRHLPPDRPAVMAQRHPPVETAGMERIEIDHVLGAQRQATGWIAGAPAAQRGSFQRDQMPAATSMRTFAGKISAR